MRDKQVSCSMKRRASPRFPRVDLPFPVTSSKSFDKFTQTRPEASLVNAVGEGRKEINVFKICLGGQDKLLLASSVVLIALRVGPCILREM